MSEKAAWMPLGSDETERQMRKALGIGEQPSVQDNGHHVLRQMPQTRQTRRQFAKDGDVSVEVRQIEVRNRRDELTSELIDARNTQHRLEAELAEAMQTIEGLRTKLAHQTLSLREAQEGREAAERALADQAEPRVANGRSWAPEAAVSPVQKKPRGHPRKERPAEVEQQPVWNDSWMR